MENQVSVMINIMNNNPENWEAPQTEPTQEELIQNIPELAENKYLYHEGYAYYIKNRELKRARCDGKEIITLCPALAGESISRISDGYVHVVSRLWDCEISDSTDANYSYKVKTDGSGGKTSFCRVRRCF